jgi:hypothetical protein
MCLGSPKPLVMAPSQCRTLPLPPNPNTHAQSRAPDALRLLTARRQQAARLESLTARTRTRLRLRRLTRDPLVTPWQFESACGRLLQHGAVLAQHAEGLSVRVSDGNRVEGQSVDLAWDAEP